MITWVLILQLASASNVVLPYTYATQASCATDLKSAIDQKIARKGWCFQQGGRS